MINQGLTRDLEQQINLAWQEINQDTHYRLKVKTRLRLYDLLVADLGMAMREFGEKKGIYFFPTVTPGLKRYFYLGLKTTELILPIWERDMERLLTVNPELEPCRSFPYIMLKATSELLKGKTRAEVEAMLEQETEYWAGMSGWHYSVGNMSEEVVYTQEMALEAIYNIHRAVSGTPPIKIKFSDEAYDEDLNDYSNADFTYPALEAYISEDPNRPGWNVPRSLPIKRDNQKALEFWQRWLFELIPQAAVVNLDELGWKIQRGWYLDAV